MNYVIWLKFFAGNVVGESRWSMEKVFHQQNQFIDKRILWRTFCILWIQWKWLIIIGIKTVDNSLTQVLFVMRQQTYVLFWTYPLKLLRNNLHVVEKKFIRKGKPSKEWTLKVLLEIGHFSPQSYTKSIYNIQPYL